LTSEHPTVHLWVLNLEPHSDHSSDYRWVLNWELHSEKYWGSKKAPYLVQMTVQSKVSNSDLKKVLPTDRLLAHQWAKPTVLHSGLEYPMATHSGKD
jgi:hypothetical protein